MSERIPEETQRQSHATKDELWAVRGEHDTVQYRLGDWTPSEMYEDLADLAAAYRIDEEELFEKYPNTDHVVLGVVTVDMDTNDILDFHLHPSIPTR